MHFPFLGRSALFYWRSLFEKCYEEWQIMEGKQPYKKNNEKN